MDPAFLGLVVDEHPAGKGRRCQDPRLQVAPLKIDHERKLSPPDAPPHAEKLWERPVLAVPCVPTRSEMRAPGWADASAFMTGVSASRSPMAPGLMMRMFFLIPSF